MGRDRQCMLQMATEHDLLLFCLIPPGALLQVFRNGARLPRSRCGVGRLGLGRKFSAFQFSENKKCTRLGKMYVMVLRAATSFIGFFGGIATNFDSRAYNSC